MAHASGGGIFRPDEERMSLFGQRARQTVLGFYDPWQVDCGDLTITNDLASLQQRGV